MVTVAGAGPAGTSAAIAARMAGAHVALFDPAPFPRQKVCGEFLSPQVIQLLRQLGVLEAFLGCRPQRYMALELHFPRTSKRAPLPEPAYGLSRFALDQLLLARAVSMGVDWRRERAPMVPRVDATGRKFPSVRGGRLFGFKAHFSGPVTDTMALYFFDGCYVGVNAVEGGVTNVCGLGPEELLRRYQFQPDELLTGFAPLNERLSMLERSTDWLITGPLCFRYRVQPLPQTGVYPAGDALSFVDPFTGTGMLGAMVSGISAGRGAALGEDPAEHVVRCRRALGAPLAVASIIRWGIRNGLADYALRLIPSNMLVGLTRPRLPRGFN